MQPGDLWLLGPHRLLCGNALEGVSYLRVLNGETAGLVFTDPPYNVPIDGHVSGLGAVQHREFAATSQTTVSPRPSSSTTPTVLPQATSRPSLERPSNCASSCSLNRAHRSHDLKPRSAYQQSDCSVGPTKLRR